MKESTNAMKVITNHLVENETYLGKAIKEKLESMYKTKCFTEDETPKVTETNTDPPKVIETSTAPPKKSGSQDFYHNIVRNSVLQD